MRFLTIASDIANIVMAVLMVIANIRGVWLWWHKGQKNKALLTAMVLGGGIAYLLSGR